MHVNAFSCMCALYYPLILCNTLCYQVIETLRLQHSHKGLGLNNSRFVKVYFLLQKKSAPPTAPSNVLSTYYPLMNGNWFFFVITFNCLMIIRTALIVNSHLNFCNTNHLNFIFITDFGPLKIHWTLNYNNDFPLQNTTTFPNKNPNTPVSLLERLQLDYLMAYRKHKIQPPMNQWQMWIGFSGLKKHISVLGTWNVMNLATNPSQSWWIRQPSC